MSALFVSVDDLIGEGAETVARRATDWGCTELAVSFAYHAARDVTPHGPARVTLRRDGVHFVPSDGAFAGSNLTPAVLQDDAELGPSIVQAAAAHGVSVVGWAVFLHNEELGTRHPEVTQRNCFGDQAAPAELCPANPRVRRYCVELALAVAEQGVREVVAESLHFDAFGHGYHHERDFVGLGVVERFVLGLCFCEHCCAHADRSGIDVSAARAAAARVAAQQLDGGSAALPDGTMLTAELLCSVAGSELRDYAVARAGIVTGLVGLVADALAERGARLSFLDLMGAVQGYGDGLPGPASGLDDGWQLGIDVAAIARHAGVAILAYARDPERVEAETRRYRTVLDSAQDAGRSSRSKLRVLLRPGQPDCFDGGNLASKVAAARECGADSVDFYHYGMLSFPVLDRVGFALAAGSANVAPARTNVSA